MIKNISIVFIGISISFIGIGQTYLEGFDDINSLSDWFFQNNSASQNQFSETVLTLR